MQIRPDTPPLGLGTLLRALLAQLEPAVEQAYANADPLMRSRYYPVFRALLMHGAATVGAIARDVGVSQPAMTQTIRQMAEDGLLEIALGDDRRARLVRLSARGEEAVATLRPVWSAVAGAAATMERETGVDLAADLQRVLDALEQCGFAARIARAQGEAV